MLTHFRINYLTNLTYFPIFLHFVDFSKVAAASPLVAAAAAAQLAAEPQPEIVLRILLTFSRIFASLLTLVEFLLVFLRLVECFSLVDF